MGEVAAAGRRAGSAGGGQGGIKAGRLRGLRREGKASDGVLSVHGRRRPEPGVARGVRRRPIVVLMMVGVVVVGMRVPVRVAVDMDVAPGVGQGVRPEGGESAAEKERRDQAPERFHPRKHSRSAGSPQGLARGAQNHHLA